MDFKLLTLIIIASIAKVTAEIKSRRDEETGNNSNDDFPPDEVRTPNPFWTTPAWPQVIIPKGGIKLRLTQHGFDYLSSVAMALVAKELDGVTLPHIFVSKGPFKVNITSINITDNPPPKIAIRTVPGFGLRISISEMAPILEADFKNRMGYGFFSMEKEGQMFVKSENISFDVDLRIGRDNASRPTVEVTNCNGSGYARARFAGGWCDGLNALSVFFSKEIKSILFAQICWRFKQDIGQNLTQLLQKVPASYVVGKVFELDYGLANFPYFSDFAMESVHKGVVYLVNKEGERMQPPFDPPRLPPVETHNKSMLYIYISSYTLNTAAYAAFHSGKLAINVTRSMIPGNYGEYLKTTCPGKTCVGTIFPQLAMRHPNTEVTLQIKAKEPPHIDFKNGKISVRAGVDAEVHVANDGRLLTINANLTTECQVAVRDGKLIFNFTEITPTTSISDSVIPELNGSGFLLNGLARMATQQFLKPKLAEYGQKGVKLPSHKDVEITNAQIIFEESLPDVIVISGDVRYLGPMPTQPPRTEPTPSTRKYKC